MLKSPKERMDNISGRRGGGYQCSPQAPVISTVVSRPRNEIRSICMEVALFTCLFTVLSISKYSFVYINHQDTRISNMAQRFIKFTDEKLKQILKNKTN